MVCVWSFRLGREPWSILCLNFLVDKTQGHFRSEKKNDPEMGHAPASQRDLQATYDPKVWRRGCSDQSTIHPGIFQRGLFSVSGGLGGGGGGGCSVRNTRFCFCGHSPEMTHHPSLPTEQLAGFCR